MALSLIIDRTDLDYEEWLALSRIPWGSKTDAQKAIWALPMKGAYNYTDLNRVGAALLELQAALASLGYSASVSARTNYASGEWPSASDMSAYVQSIADIRSALTVASATPAAPTNMDDGTVTVWNNIEKILLDVEAIITSMSHTLDLGWALGIAHIGLYGGLL